MLVFTVFTDLKLQNNSVCIFDSYFWPKGHWWRVHKSLRFFCSPLDPLSPILCSSITGCSCTLCNTSSFLAVFARVVPCSYLPEASLWLSSPPSVSLPVEVRAQTRTVLVDPDQTCNLGGWWCRAQQNGFDGLWAIILTEMSKAYLTFPHFPGLCCCRTKPKLNSKPPPEFFPGLLEKARRQELNSALNLGAGGHAGSPDLDLCLSLVMNNYLCGNSCSSVTPYFNLNIVWCHLCQFLKRCDKTSHGITWHYILTGDGSVAFLRVCVCEGC